MEVLGREAIRRMKLSRGWHSSRPWFEGSDAEHFSDNGRIYMSFILMNEVEGTEGEEEYHVTSILGAFSVETGELLWKFETDLNSRPTKQFFFPLLLVSSDRVYWGIEGRLYALDKATGEVKWGMDGFMPQQSIAGIEAQGALYLYSAYPAVLYAFDLAQIDKLHAEGKEWWTFEWQFYRDKARNSHKRSMLQEAIAEYKEAIKRAPGLEALWLYAELGEVYYEQGNLEAAEKTYAEAGLPRETDWLVIGPFDNTNNKGWTIAYPPESEIVLSATYQGKTGAVQWQKADDGFMDGRLDFTKMFTPTEWVVAYALIDVISPDDRKAQLRIGSGDGVKVWLNGQVIWTNQAPRSLRFDQDVAPIELKKGANHLLFKVDQGIGDWGLTARITDEKGQPLEGLQYVPAR